MSFDFSARIDKQSPRPIYLQLFDAISQQITEGRLIPGQKLPSENEFCDAYHISRTTVRQTFRELENQGIIQRRRGLGTFISQQKVRRQLNDLYSFSADMRRLGKTPSSKILSFRLVEKEQCPGQAMDFDSRRCIEVVRLRLADGVPMLMECTYLAVDLCPELSWERLETTPLYDILMGHYGLQPHKAIETFDATVMNKNEAQQLCCNAGEAAFLIRRSTWDTQGRLIEHTRSVMPGSRSRFEVTMFHGQVQIDRKPR